MDERKKSESAGEICPSKRDKLSLHKVRSQLERTNGPEYWRSLEELAGSPEFREMMHREFPKGASDWVDEVSRRGFLKLMGASLALAGMTGCTKLPLEPIVPYVRQPEQVVPGRPMFYASAFTLSGYAAPLLVTSHLGRPTKIEGNPEHPVSLGATDVFAQASLLDLYDPDRSQTVSYLGDVRSWGAFLEAIRGLLNVQKGLQGAGIRILTQTISSPTLADQIRNLLKIYPQAKWHVYEPVNRDNVYAGAHMAFGEPVEPQYKLENADVIVSLDADFLYSGFPGMTRYAREYAKRRNPDENMNRLYVVESTPSSTGVKADNRLPLRAVDIESFARAVYYACSQPSSGGAVGMATTDMSRMYATFLTKVVPDLISHRGSSVVIPGDTQPPAVHAWAHAINQVLGNVGRTVFYTDSVNANPVNQIDSLRDLVSDMRSGKVDMLLILGGNPAYDAPADLGFADALKNTKVPFRAHLGLYYNETSELCHWHVNEAHYLEAWSDTRAYDGTVSIVQPLIEPLYAGRSAHEFISLLAGQAETRGYDLVRAYWQAQHKGADFEAFWRRSVHDGWIEGTTFQPKQVALKATNFPASTLTAQGMEINFRCDPSIYDGRFSNNGWLQELPKPLTKMTWDNLVMVGPAMAERLHLEKEDLVELEVQGRKIEIPVWVQAGHPDNSVTVFFGYGRTRAGRAGTGAGVNVYPLRTSSSPWFASGLQIRNTGRKYKLATTQGQQTMETPVGARPLVREATLEEYKQHPRFALEEKPPREQSLYPGFDYKDEPYAWGMVIDLNACVGCNTCIIACQSENNIPVVGKEQVVRGRHMHWLRVDAYYQGDRANPRAFFQPVPCMQCENAPCEVVCPVGATVHSSEGLNDMVYNRCVGTRYCSNNCPYKVRRFNFLLFQDWDTPQYKLMRNPDVTVRSRGVMEKCTYCIQRITQHRIDAERADRRIGDGELQTACQQACPANAIVFGNINDRNSRVSQLKNSPLNYGLLDDLNTRPRTTYLAEVRNPNPELSTGETITK
jgi:MoCo/4Fe-4S cofactor protein with predicted Tat translocation signal